MKILYFLIFLSSCASLTNSNLQRRTVEDYYISTGVEKYFLADLPSWANFDQAGSCFRAKTIRYFDIDALMKSYRLTYNMAIQVQAAFNEELSEFKKIDKTHSPNLKEEELLFYKVTEKISSKILFFDPPSFSRVNLIWFDEILGDPLKLGKLQKLLNSSDMESGVPVLVSFCLTKEEIEQQYPTLHSKMITAELFSVFDGKGEKKPGFRIDLDQFFLSNQNLYFYSQKNTVPTEEIHGTYKVLNY